MIVLDDALLQEIGLDRMPTSHRRLMLRYIYDVLEQRVGLAFAEEMTDEEFEEFAAFVDANDEEGALGWLSDKRPDYPEVVARVFEALKEELRVEADTLVSVSARYPTGEARANLAAGAADEAEGPTVPGQGGASE